MRPCRWSHSSDRSRRYDLLGRGYTTEQLLKQYDNLTPEDVRACLAYAAEILQSEKVYALPR